MLAQGICETIVGKAKCVLGWRHLGLLCVQRKPALVLFLVPDSEILLLYCPVTSESHICVVALLSFLYQATNRHFH